MADEKKLPPKGLASAPAPSPAKVQADPESEQVPAVKPDQKPEPAVVKLPAKPGFCKESDRAGDGLKRFKVRCLTKPDCAMRYAFAAAQADAETLYRSHYTLGPADKLAVVALPD